jgi:outer membrane protein TolC
VSAVQPLALLGLLAVLCCLPACSTSHYKKSADKEVYAIIEQVEGKIFGHTNGFTIDTPYSARKPEEILPPELIEDRLKKGHRTMSIEDALDVAAASRRYQTQKESLYLSALSLTGSRYQFSPHFLAMLGGDVSRGTDGQLQGGGNVRMGVSQLLKSGGRLGLNLANDLLRYYTGSPRNSAISVVSVNLAQPLLRGFGKNNSAVESLTQSERNVVYAVRNYSYFQDQFAVEIVSDYFALLAQKDIIRNRYTNYLSRVQSTQRLESRAKDREALNDVDQTRQAELTSRNNYINALANFSTALDNFKLKLGLPLGDSISLDDTELAKLQKTGPIPVPLDQEKAYRIAVEKQLPMLNSIDKFEDVKRKVRIAADGLRAQLNLVGDASLNSQPPTDYTKFDINQVRAGAGLDLDLPLDRLNERNTYRASLVSFESEVRNLTLALDTLRSDIASGMRTLAQRRQNYEIQKNALALADRRVESVTLLVQAGRSEARDLVDAQDAQISAQNAVVAALVDFQNARLQLMLDIGALRSDQPEFWLKDHLEGYLPATPQPAWTQPQMDEPLINPDAFFNNRP